MTFYIEQSGSEPLKLKVGSIEELISNLLRIIEDAEHRGRSELYIEVL